MTTPWNLANFQTGQTPARLRVLGQHGLLPDQRAELQSKFSIWLSTVRTSPAPTHMLSGQLRDGSPFKFKRNYGMCEVIVEPHRTITDVKRKEFIAWAVRFDTSYIPAIFDRRIYKMPKRVLFGFVENHITSTETDNPYTLDPPRIHGTSHQTQRVTIQIAEGNAPITLEGTWNFNNLRVAGGGDLCGDLVIDSYPTIFTSGIGLTQQTIGWSEEAINSFSKWKIIGVDNSFAEESTVVPLVALTENGVRRTIRLPTSLSRASDNTDFYVITHSMPDSFGFPLSTFTPQELNAFRDAAKPFGDQVRAAILANWVTKQQIAQEILDMRLQDRPQILSNVHNYLFAGVGASGNLHTNASVLNIPYKTIFTTPTPLNYQNAGSSHISEEIFYGGLSGEMHSKFEQTITSAGNNCPIDAGDIGSYKLKEKIADSGNVFGSQVSGITVFKNDYLIHHSGERVNAVTSNIGFTTPQLFTDAGGELVVGDAEGGYEFIFEAQLGVGIDPSSSEPQPKDPAKLITVFFEYECFDAGTNLWHWTVLPGSFTHDSVWIEEERDPELSDAEWEASRIDPPWFHVDNTVRGLRICRVREQTRLAAGGWTPPVDRPFKHWQIPITALVENEGFISAVSVALNTPPKGRPAPGSSSPDLLWDATRKKAREAATNISGDITAHNFIARALVSIGVLNV